MSLEFSHLHVHSQFSFLTSAVKLSELDHEIAALRREVAELKALRQAAPESKSA